MNQCIIWIGQWKICENNDDRPPFKQFDHKLGQWLRFGLLRDVDRILQLVCLLSENGLGSWNLRMNWLKC